MNIHSVLAKIWEKKVQKTSNTSKLGLIYEYENVIPKCNVFGILVLCLIEKSLIWNQNQAFGILNMNSPCLKYVSKLFRQ